MSSAPTLPTGSPALSPAKQALLAARLKGQHRVSDLVRRGSTGVAPASFAQERLWFLERVGQGGVAYHAAEPLRLSGALNVDALERALGDIVQRHEALRTTFREVDGALKQVIAAYERFTLPVSDVSGVEAAEREAEARRRISEQIARPFDLSAGPLVRALLLRLGPQDHILSLCVHHIVVDGWSWRVLFRDMWTLYGAYRDGRTHTLPDLPVQYVDYAEWQRKQAHGEEQREERQRLLDYWREQLAGAPTLLALPVDHPRPDVQRNRGAVERIAIPSALMERLQAVGRAEGATLYVVALAAFQILLSRYTGGEDVVVGTTVAGRTRAEVQDLIGLFMNTLVLRTRVSGDSSIRDVLRRSREVTLSAYEHQGLPFEQLVAELRPKRTLSHAPLFQVLFELDDRDRAVDAVAGLTIAPMTVTNETAKVDLALRLRVSANGLSGGLRYNTDLFEPATIRRMATHFERVLEQVASCPDRTVSAVTLLDDADRRQVTEAFNDTAAAYPSEQCIHELFEAQAARTPQALALQFEQDALTYEELNARANQMAHYLRRRGVGPEARVGVCLERSVELLVAILGVLKAGGAYVPLDTGSPPERLAYMLEDSAVGLLLTQERLRARLPLPPHVEAIAVDEQWPRIADEPIDTPASGVTSENLCYVIYTSGSTGRPKGVAMHHRGVSNYIDWGVRAYGASAGQGAPVFTSMAVDLTVTNLLPLFAGRPVRLLPEEHAVEALANLLRTRPEFGLIKITPTHLSLLTPLLTVDEARAAARTLVVGADFLSAETTLFWQDHAPGVRLMNEYGPTETVVGCSAYTLPPGQHREGPVPVGGPIQNLRFYVLDESFEPVPIGLPGELFIGGVGVARGYLGRTPLTAERFVPDPFAAPGARMYRTGDRACWQADGTLLILGRIDNQVKIRGYRVELGEVEAVLRRHASVRECLAVVREDRPGDRRLVAYVVGDVTTEELRAHARMNLPDYMVPGAFVALAALPETSTGKFNRASLPPPRYEAAASELDAPADAIEVQLIHIWEELLGVHPIGTTQDFFELGGNSLLVLHLFAQIRSRLNCDLPLATIVAGATVRQMASAIREVRATSIPAGSIVPLQPHGTLPPLFCVHPAGRGVNNYLQLVRHLGSQQPVFGITDQGEDLARPVEVIASEHIRAIRSVQPEGPYHLLGWSFGAVVAYEMAVQLERLGQRVAFVGLMDTMEPVRWRELPRRPAALRIATLAKEVAETMGRRVSLRAEDLAGLDVDEQCRRAVDALHAQGTAPRDFTAATFRRDYYDAVELRDQSKRGYRPRTFPGTLTLFRPTTVPEVYERFFAGSDEDERLTLGWSRLVGGRVQVHRIPGTHVGMSCEPGVRVLAQRVRESLSASVPVLEAVRIS